MAMIIVASEGIVQGLLTQVLRRVCTICYRYCLFPVGETLGEHFDVGLFRLGRGLLLEDDVLGFILSATDLQKDGVVRRCS